MEDGGTGLLDGGLLLLIHQPEDGHKRWNM